MSEKMFHLYFLQGLKSRLTVNACKYKNCLLTKDFPQSLRGTCESELKVFALKEFVKGFRLREPCSTNLYTHTRLWPGTWRDQTMIRARALCEAKEQAPTLRIYFVDPFDFVCYKTLFSAKVIAIYVERFKLTKLHFTRCTIITMSSLRPKIILDQ